MKGKNMSDERTIELTIEPIEEETTAAPVQTDAIDMDIEIPAPPKLTFDDIPEAVTASIVPKKEDKLSVESLADSLTDSELAQVDEFAKQIDVSDSRQTSMFGAVPQKKMADFSGDMLSKIQTKNVDVAGDLITQVVAELKNLDGHEEKKRILGFFRRQKDKVALIKNQYDSVEKNIDKITGELEGHQISLIKDSAMLDKLYELNLSYFKELTMYLLAGRKKLEETRNVELAELMAKAQKSGSTEDAEAVQKLSAACNRFEKKLTDLDLSRTVAMQMAPQLRLVQNNEMLMIEKIQTTLVNTIPLWKSQMVLSLGLSNTEKALRAQNAVTEMTNDLLRKNSEMLHQSTVEIARESERGIVEVETLRAANENLIKTFDDVMKIQQEGRAKRAEAEVELRKIETELKKKLLEEASMPAIAGRAAATAKLPQ